VGVRGAVEFTNGLGELLDGRGAATNGVGMPPGTGALIEATGAGPMPPAFASLE
jgi:hypothetical protein